MRRRRARACLIGTLLATGAASASPQGNEKGLAGQGGDHARGGYLAAAAGCAGCHTGKEQGSQAFAGGRALETPFGTFYGPNITPDRRAGIGAWTEADLMRALRKGIRPDGAHYFPAFPYPSFTNITDADLRDLWAFLKTIPPSNQVSRAHELRFPFNIRALMGPWKWLFFEEGPFAADPEQPATVQRGAYLVRALGHCGECHTPRNLFGGLKTARHLAGVPGEGAARVPNLTPTRLGKWSDEELREFLLSGISPDFDAANATMSEVVENTTSKLTPEDLSALIAYLRSVPPLPQ